MDLAPTPAQQLLVSTARSLLERRCPLERVQALSLTADGFDALLWKETAALGWPGLLVPPDLGGSGGTMRDVLLLAEEMGHACLPGPFLPSAVVSTRVLIDAGEHRRARALLPRLALGERIATLAALEDDGRLEPGALLTRVERGRVSGRKLFVPDAGAATDLIVIGRSDAGPTAALLPMDRPGIAALPLDSMAGQRLFEVTFDGVEVSAEDLLGSPGAGWALVAPALAQGALAQCADMVGAAQRVLELCVEHARVRQQFGRPIGSFQAVQHLCADLFRDVETARWLARETAWRCERAAAGAAESVAAAKAYASEACLRVARRGHQVMGAIGYSAEHPLHLFHKRILSGALAWGGPDQHLETVARAIGLD
jgi:alkylation response protein AidB-like acyl-CoA dehydrogenase